MDRLTPKQRQALDIIAEHIDSEGTFPTQAHMMKELGARYPHSITQYLRALVRKGHLVKIGFGQYELPHFTCPCCGARVATTEVIQ